MTEKNNPILKIIIIILLAIIGIFVVREIFGDDSKTGMENSPSGASDNNSRNPTNAIVSGNIVFTGLKPTGDEKGYIGIEYKKSSDTTYTDSNLELPLVNDSAFQTAKAVEGQTYDIKAYVYGQGKKIKTSEIVRVTAPATNVKIPLNVTWDDLPDEVAQEYPTSMAGNVYINGYIPAGSTVRILYKQESSAVFTTLSTLLDAAKIVPFEITDALNGREYKVYAELLQGTTSIGTSTVINSTAPADGLKLTLNSNANQPEAKKVTINGYVVINGIVEEDQQMEVYLKEVATDQVTTIATLPAKTNTWWSYDQAVEGKLYKVNAMAVASNGTPVYSKSVEFTAPATNIELVIDTGTYLEKPEERPTLESCTEVKEGTYKAKIRYENVSKATRYWLQVGSEYGTNDVFDAVQNGPKKDEPLFVEVDISEDNEYFARYSYSFCDDSCTGEANFSDFSNSLEFVCPKEDD